MPPKMTSIMTLTAASCLVLSLGFYAMTLVYVFEKHRNYDDRRGER